VLTHAGTKGEAGGSWSAAQGTAAGLFGPSNPQLVVVPRRNGAATATAAVEVEVEVAWAAQQPEDLAVHLAVYRQAAPHPVSRLKALRTEDRVAWEYVLGTRASVHVALEEGVSSYVVVLSASEAGIKGEGSFWVRVESSDKAQFDLWDVPLVPRLRAERGSRCAAALAKHAKAKAPSDPEPGSIFVEAPEDFACMLYDTCPVDDIMAALRSEPEGAFFVDPEFPPEAASLNKEPDSDKTLDGAGGWARFHEFVADPQMRLGGLDPDDVIQGQLGNCWFVACLAALALVPEIAEQLIYPAQYNPSGVYAVRVFWRRAWRWVVVDDWVPMDKTGAEAAFTRSRCGNELWMMVLEKAFAKLHSSYQMMRGSFCSRAGAHTALGSCKVLSMLTGGTTNHERILKKSGSTVFEAAKDVATRGGIMTLGTRDDCDAGGSGLVPNHAYSIVQMCQTKREGERLMNIRNTWGSSEWRLKWSDEDEVSWTPPLKKELGFVQGDDGIFWMSAEDFVRRYESINTCVLQPSNFPPANVGAAPPIVPIAAVAPAATVGGEAAPPPMLHRLTVKGRWTRQTCGGLGSTENPQIALVSASGETSAATMNVCLTIPSLMQNSAFAAKLRLDVYGYDDVGAEPGWIPNGDARYTLLASATATVQHGGVQGVYVHLEPSTLGSRSCIVVVPQIAPAEREHYPIEAGLVLLVMSSRETATRTLEQLPPPPPKLSAAAKVALVQKKQRDEAQARAKAAAAVVSYGLRNGAAAASSPAHLTHCGEIPYQLPPHLTPARGYPLREQLRPASMGVKQRATPGVSLAVSHVAAGWEEDDRNLRLLRDSSGRCFVPANATVVLCWDFVAGEFGSLGVKEKYRDRVALIDRRKNDDDADVVWSSDVGQYAPRDSMRVALPIELELGVEYEFRYFTWRADSTYGDFAGARSQPLLVVPRAGIDTDGWIKLSSTYAEDADGVLHPPRDRDVTVEWDVSELAGITEESRAYYREWGTKNFQDFIGIYPVDVWDAEGYAYYFDVPDDDAQKELALGQYYLETYCSEPGVTYVVRYIREKSCVAESAPFQYDGAAEAGEDQDDDEPEEVTRAGASTAEFSVDGDTRQGFTARWANVPEATDSDFVAIFAQGDDPYSSAAYYEYADGATAGSLRFAPFEELGVGEAGVEYFAAYVSGTTSAAISPTVLVGRV
jgi:hypothetical protein